MAEGYFTEAGSLMREGGLDPREVLFYTVCTLFLLALWEMQWPGDGALDTWPRLFEMWITLSTR